MGKHKQLGTSGKKKIRAVLIAGIIVTLKRYKSMLGTVTLRGTKFREADGYFCDSCCGHDIDGVYYSLFIRAQFSLGRKVMKRIWIVLAVILISMSLTTPVLGDSLSEILGIYGVAVDYVDIEMFQQSLGKAKSEYYGLIEQWNRDEYFKRTQQVAAYMEMGSVDLLTKLDTDRRYLISLVNVEADMELIFAAENEYRSTLKACSEQMFGRPEFDLSEFSLSGVTSSEINSVVDSINQIVEEINSYSGSVRPDIGSSVNLESPTKGNWRITSKYGYRTNPITGAGQEFHNGLDLAAPLGTDTNAVFAGKVIFAGNKGDSLGNYIIMAHSNEFQTLYGHLSKINVEAGDMVAQYQKIGEVGSTSRSTGPHLHLAVYINGQTVDPLKLFSGRDKNVTRTG